MSEARKVSVQFKNWKPIEGVEFTEYKPVNSVPIMYGMHYPGIVLFHGVPYNDPSVKPPCYRIGDDPRVGYNTAKWVEKPEDDVIFPEPETETESLLRTPHV